MRCPNCGKDNPQESRFCMECGTRLVQPTVLEPAAPPPALTPEPEAGARWMPPTPIQPTNTVDASAYRGASTNSGSSDLPPTDPEWRMSPAGPLPDRPRRRIWFWILVIIGVILLICVLIMIWMSTLGRTTVENFLATAAVEATRQAGAGATPVANP